jgi:hypothetical protein
MILQKVQTMKAFLIEWSQPRMWRHVVESGTPAFAKRDSDSTRQLIEQMSLGEFAKAGLVLTVYSAALGERVIFASDNAPLEEQLDRLTYRAAELRELLHVTIDQLKRVHALKKTFRATIEFVGPSGLDHLQA